MWRSSMKVGVYIRGEHEVLYDSLTDEVIWREVKADGEEPVVIRVPFMDVMRARLKTRHEFTAASEGERAITKIRRKS